MKLFLFTLIFSLLFSCGFKAPPSPIFPTSKTPVDDEVTRRNLEQDKEKKAQEQENNQKQSIDFMKDSANGNN